MLGPVFYQEMLFGSRRNKLHVFRWIYAGWLVLQVFWFWIEYLDYERERGVKDFSYVEGSAPVIMGGWFTETFVLQQMLFVVLAIPAFVAGAVTDEKRRGTLQYLLCTDLDARHIILGKLFGRIAQVVMVALAGFPLYALFAGFGGTPVLTVFVAAIVLIVPSFAIACATMLASVLCKQTRDAVLALYLILIVCAFAVWLVGGILDYFNPIFVLEPIWSSTGSEETNIMFGRLIGSMVAWGAVGLTCLGLAMWRMRPVYIKELESPPPKQRVWLGVERAPIDEDPVRWRERNVEGLAPTPQLRQVPPWLTIILIILVTALSSSLILVFSMPSGKGLGDVVSAIAHLDVVKLTNLWPDAGMGFLVQSLVVMLVASLVVGVRCSGAITGERERMTWEALLLTPMSAKSMIHGKLWGIMAASYWYLLAYGATAVVFSVLGGAIALFWTVIWLGATVLAMYFIGAAGLFCSARSKNSWRSLLGTIAYGYLGGLFMFLVTSPVPAILALILILLLRIMDIFLNTGISTWGFASFGNFMIFFLVVTPLTLAVICWAASRWWFLPGAQRWVADRERTRHWYDEPIYRRPRRRPIVEREAWSRQ
jgi:ABC-type transport system involved in multi-copper enzyme maturation permease subunit